MRMLNRVPRDTIPAHLNARPSVSSALTLRPMVAELLGSRLVPCQKHLLLRLGSESPNLGSATFREFPESSSRDCRLHWELVMWKSNKKEEERTPAPAPAYQAPR